MKANEIQIRDPFVYVENGVYYLYGSTDRDIWKSPGKGFDCYKSRDLIEWEPLGNIFDRPQSFWGKVNFWAPEMHAYKGKYYLFASFKAEGVCRGTSVLKADSPAGPFRPWSAGAVTPNNWECLDGTLYVENGAPYMIFCHEWAQIGDGEMCLMPLTDDLSAPAGEPVTLFRASQAKWAMNMDKTGAMRQYVTDGPNMYRCENGELLMLWSTISPSGYAIGCARSSSGRVSGPWTIDETPLFDKDGGHGMIFTDLTGQKRLAIHTPNSTPNERAVFIPISENNGRLEITK